MSHGVLLHSSTPSSLTLAPSGSELTRTFTSVAEGPAVVVAVTGGAAVAAATGAVAVPAPVALAGMSAVPTLPGLLGRSATYPMMPAMASAPTTAATSMPLLPVLPGGCDMSGAPAVGESLGTASGDGMLPGSLPVGERNEGFDPLMAPLAAVVICGPLPEPDSERYSPVPTPLMVAVSVPPPTRLSDASTSSIDRKRWSGSLAMQRASVSSMAGDTLMLGFIWRSGGASSFTCAIRMFTLFGRSNGTLPVIISY